MGECKHGTWLTFCADCDLEQVEAGLQLHGGGESRSSLPPIAQPDTFSFEAQLAERLRDPEWLSKWNADAEGLRSFQEMLNSLRRKEGDSITLLCDNPDFNGQPNNAVECCGDWTGWQEQRFTGDSLLLAVRAAYVARAGVTTSQQASMEGSELESRSDFASGSGDKVPETNRVVIRTTRDRYFLAPWQGTTRNIESAHHYTASEAADHIGKHPDEYLTVVPVARVHQALSGGGEATPKSEAKQLGREDQRLFAEAERLASTSIEPILQGPTREEVREAFKRIVGRWMDSRDQTMPDELVDEAITVLIALLNPTSPWRDEKAAILDIVQQVHSDLQFTMIALEKNDPSAEIVIRVSDVLGIIQEKLAPLLKPRPALPGGSE